MMWIIRKYLDRYRAFAPVHSEMGDVTVYGKTVYECAKKFLSVQEIV